MICDVMLLIFLLDCEGMRDLVMLIMFVIACELLKNMIVICTNRLFDANAAPAILIQYRMRFCAFKNDPA